MKFCPYCGIEQTDDTALFCMECGKMLPEKVVLSDMGNSNQELAEQKKRKKKTSQKTLKTKKSGQEQPLNLKDDGYDGYYEDILPADQDLIGQTLDRQLIKKVAALAVGVMLVIIACVAIMYLL